jgi:DNA-binding NtrC family response regulator
MRPTVVLIVEDESLVLDLLADMVTELGHKVIVASNADDALKLLEARRDITVVITDIDMPGSMDGLRLAAVIRDRWPPTRLIITTAKAKPDTLPERAYFVAKPYSQAQIGEAMERAN